MARVAAVQHRLPAAEQLLLSAEDAFHEIASRVDTDIALLAVSSAYLELTRARDAGESGDYHVASNHLAIVHGILRGPSPKLGVAEPMESIAQRSGDVRNAMLGLKTALLSLHIKAATTDMLIVCAAGRWFETQEAGCVSLETRRGPRRLLDVLAKQALDAPGTALTLSQLFEGGWPGERVSADSAASRVYVAISTLRKLGLKAFLLKQDEGYMLDPKASLFIVEDTPNRL